MHINILIKHYYISVMSKKQGTNLPEGTTPFQIKCLWKYSHMFDTM